MSEFEITPELLADLKAKAEKATPGSWEQYEYFPLVITDSVNPICEIYKGRYTDRDGAIDAAYISTANPSVIQALIEEYENKQEALHGMFLLVDQLKACMNLDTDASIEETIQGAISLINDIDGQSGEMNANGEAQEIMAELEKEKSRLEVETPHD